MTFVKASSPWSDPFLVERDSISILPGGLSNVTLSGVNLAPSPFFRVKSRDGNLPLLSVSDQSQSISSASIQVEGECYTNASLEVTNNYLAGDGVTLTIPVSSVNLFDGLVHHYPSDNTEENRNLIKDSASQLPFILSIPQNVATICTWVFFDNLPDFPSAGWKFLCYVEGTESANATVYLNGYPAADQAHREVIASLFQTWMDSGRAFGTHSGKIDDIWMYNRRLKSCEVEARYYTSEYALSLQTNPGFLPIGQSNLQVTMRFPDLSIEDFNPRITR